MPTPIDGKVRVAILGCGGISKAHAKGILAHADKIECVALCDVSEENLQARSEQLGGVATRYHDWKEMLSEMGGALDAVIICLPHHLHTSAVLDVVAAGKHILSEKPICMNLEEADRIIAAVREAGVTYMAGHNTLFIPAIQEARRLLDVGEIGAAWWIRSSSYFLVGDGKRQPFRNTWRGQTQTMGGGALIDGGFHATYRLLYLANSPVVGVRASFGRFSLEMEGEDTANVQVRFANGNIGEVAFSWAIQKPFGTYPFHVVGERGQMFGNDNEVFLLRSGESEPVKHSLNASDTFTDQIGHFATCLKEGRRPIHGAKEGRETLDVILQATRDAEGWQQYATKKM